MPTILIAGATGNTGRSVVETLPKLLHASKSLSAHRIVALTRSLDSPAAQQLAKIPGVEVVEKNWVEITPEWLRQNEVVRAFVASPSQASQFAEESMFLVAALRAGVEYIVRISTAALNIRPDSDAAYPRSHWAIEAMLAAAEFIKQYRKTGKQGALRLIGSADAPVGVIDPYDIGVLAAHLLAQENFAAHNNRKYIVNGPEDITGNQIVDIVEQHIGVPVEDVHFKDLSFVDYLVSLSADSKSFISTIPHALAIAWEGKCPSSTTSKEVLELAAPKSTPADVLKTLLEG